MRVLLSFAALCVAQLSLGQHLWWDHNGVEDTTCVYGEITVLATSTTIYYCGVNWHPGEPAGGYCGIQHNSTTEKRTIFSIWDTSPSLHPEVTYADPNTLHNRFGGEGEGGHTHMIWNWSVGQTFKFYVRKHPSERPESTAVDYYVYDPGHEKWLHSATITCPNGGFKSVPTIAGGLASFLENFSGQNRDVAKIATYNLWLGHSADDLKRLTVAHGDGIWGELGDAMFLAEGTRANLETAFAERKTQYGSPAYGGSGVNLPPLRDRPLSQRTIMELSHLRD